MKRIGDFEIRSVQTGTFRLDGGAMFGVVPKVLWGNVVGCDEQNRIYLATRTLLAIDRRADRIVLVDTGCGDKWNTEAATRFVLDHDRSAITGALARLGLAPEQVTDVIVTHLHFDHNGGLTGWVDQPGGPTTLLFPAARHWIHRKQWEHAHRPHAKDRASYLVEDFAALIEDRLTMVEGDSPASPMDGIEWFLSHGHTPYQLLPLFRDGRDSLLFTGDVVPTVAHLRPTWVMAYDLFPTRTIEEKELLYRRSLDEGMVLAFPHDPAVAGVELDGTVDRPVAARPLPLDI
jgi:glyoxylase-like metal-dependent hydrolase (beta-lactamase superfamily II)